MSYTCEFCNKNFQREKTLLNHLCANKLKWMKRDERYVKIGFMAFQRWYKLNGYKKEKTYWDFMKSRYYTAFTKFGKHCVDILAIEIESFIDFLIQGSVKLDHWCRDDVYESFVRYQTSRESVERAIERNTLLLEQWAKDNEEEWYDFFRQVGTGEALRYIKTGRLSPWLLLNCPSASDLLNRMSNEQLDILSGLVNYRSWERKFKEDPEAVKLIKSWARKSGL